jgi:hypothetical protein
LWLVFFEAARGLLWFHVSVLLCLSYYQEGLRGVCQVCAVALLADRGDMHASAAVTFMPDGVTTVFCSDCY